MVCYSSFVHESLIHPLDIYVWIPGKKRRKLLWRLAKRQPHRHTTFYPLQWWISLNVDRLRSLVWTLTLERLSTARRLPTQFPFIKDGGQTTRKEARNLCLFRVACYYHFSLRLQTWRHHRMGKHHTWPRKSWNESFGGHFPPNCRTGCVDGVLQRQRPLGSDDFPGEGQVDLKSYRCADMAGGVLLMIFSKFVTYSLRHVHFQSFSER